MVFARWCQCAPHITHASTSTPSPNSKRYLNWYSTQHSVPTLYSAALPLPAGGSWSPSSRWFLGPIRAHNPHGISIGSAVFTQSVPILYNGPSLLPSKFPLPIGWSAPPSNTWFPGPTRVLSPNGILIGSTVLQGSLVWQTDRPTDRPCYSVGNNRPHRIYVHSTAMLI